MLKVLLHILVGMLLLPSCRHAPPPGLHRVTTEPTAFTPALVEIAARDSVEWVFRGQHNAVFGDVPGRPADIPVSSEGRYVRSFGTPGRFTYECLLHPGMTGEVVVR